MEKNTKIGLIIVGIIMLGITVVISVAVATAPEPVQAPAPAQYQVQSYEVKGYFMKSCVGESSDYEYCSCVYNSLEEIYGVDGIIGIGQEYEDTGKLPEELISASTKCLN